MNAIMYEVLVIFPIALQLNYYIFHTILTNMSETYKNLTINKKTETLSRINSSLVGILIAISAFYVETTEQRLFMSRLFTGYIIYDIPYAGNLPMLMHHIASIGLFFYIKSFASPDEIRQMYNVIVVLESSAILISTCWILKTFKYPMNCLHKTLMAIAFLSWSTMRLVAFPYILYACNSYKIQVLFSPLIALNVYWFTVLTQFVTRQTA